MRNFIEYGYSLLEMVAVLAIVAIITAIALPNYTSFLTRHRIKTEAEKLTAAINFTRFEALRRHSVVTLCKSDDGKHCGGQWQNGWLIFIDPNKNAEIISTNQILRFYNHPLHSTKLDWSATRSNNYLQFSPTGTTYGQSGKFTLSAVNTKQPYVYYIVVSQTGRIRNQLAKTSVGA